MSETEKYSGYGWIKVKRANPVEFEGNKYVEESHHIAETTFLIDKVREMAKLVDVLQASVAYYRKLEEAHRREASRQARWDQDYLPYYDDDRDR